MWHVLFDVGGWVFWSLVAIYFITTLAFTANERLWSSILLTIGTALVFTLFSSVSWPNWSWTMLGAVIAGYISIGSFWSIIHWTIFSRKNMKVLFDKITKKRTIPFKDWSDGDKRDFLIDFANEWNYNTGGFSRRLDFNPSMSTAGMMDRVMEVVTPNPSDEKSRISVWLLFWPFDILWFGLSDVVQWLYDMLCEALERVFKAINRLVFSGVRKNMGIE